MHLIWTEESELKLLIFFGKTPAEDYLDWEESVENYFQWKPMVEERKVFFVKIKLKGIALQ